MREVVCRGSYALGTACGKCSRCKSGNTKSEHNNTSSEHKDEKPTPTEIEFDEYQCERSCQYVGTHRETYFEGARWGFEEGRKAQEAKDRAEIEAARLQALFAQQYFNPADTSFGDMMDTFRTLSPEQKEKLINLTKSLKALGEDEK